MLVDVDFQENSLALIIADGKKGRRVVKGVYEINHFNLDLCISPEIIKEQFPDLRGLCYDEKELGCYGVCDDYRQILGRCPGLRKDKNRKFVISITCIKKEDQPEFGGGDGISGVNT